LGGDRREGGYIWGDGVWGKEVSLPKHRCSPRNGRKMRAGDSRYTIERGDLKWGLFQKEGMEKRERDERSDVSGALGKYWDRRASIDCHKRKNWGGIGS